MSRPKRRPETETTADAPTVAHAFDSAFLRRLPHLKWRGCGKPRRVRPWEVRKLAPARYAVARSAAARPVMVLVDLDLALAAAAVLPAVAGPPRYELWQTDDSPYPLVLTGDDAGSPVGWTAFRWDDYALAVSVGEHLARQPGSLAQLLEAAGLEGLQRTAELLGRLLDCGFGETPRQREEPDPEGSPCLIPEFESLFAQFDAPVTSLEAFLSGPWEVRGMARDRYAVARVGEAQAQAVCTCLPLALVSAAVFLGLGREDVYLVRDSPASQGPVPQLRSVHSQHPVGWVAHDCPSILAALQVADALQRSPASLAWLLAAAGPRKLRQAGELLAASVSLRDPSTGLDEVLARDLGFSPGPRLEAVAAWIQGKLGGTLVAPPGAVLVPAEELEDRSPAPEAQ